MNGTRWDVFISHASVDARGAAATADKLTSEGLKVFLATQELNALVGSAQWSEKIDEAIDASSAVLLLVTPAALKSKWVEYEWRSRHDDILAGRGGLLIPVCWEGPGPDQLGRALRRHQVVDARPRRFEGVEAAQVVALLTGYRGEPRIVQPKTTEVSLRNRRALMAVVGLGGLGAVAGIGSALLSNPQESSPTPATSPTSAAPRRDSEMATPHPPVVDDDETEQVPAPPAPLPAAKPYKIEDCELLSKNYGSWSPSIDEVASVGSFIATDICYGYWEHDPRRLAETIRHCGGVVGHGTMSFHLLHDGANQCWLEFRAASLSGRHWFWVRSFYARGAQFGDQVDIIELSDGELERYASAWQCPMSLQAAWNGDELSESSGLTSTTMRTDWATLPGLLRGFFCTARLLGDDLSAPGPIE
jgi:hypothetical protein